MVPSRARLLLLSTTAVLAGAFARPASSQIIRGQVLDATDGRTLALAQVMLLPVDGDSVLQGVVASEEGGFELRLRGAGTYRLRAELLGYASVTSLPFHVESRQIRSVELRMDREVIVLSPLTVVAERTESVTMTDVRRRERLGFGTFLFREDLEARSGSRLEEILVASGLTVSHYLHSPENKARGLGGTVADPSSGLIPIPLVSARQAGLRQCYSSIYLNGARVVTGDQLHDSLRVEMALERSFDIFQLRPEEIEAIEIYRGPAQVPAEFGGVGSDCGVVALWSREGRFEWRAANHDPPPARLRVGASIGRQRLSGYLPPEAGVSFEATASVAALSRVGASAFLGLGQFTLPAGVVSYLTQLDEEVPHDVGATTLTLLSAGIGPRVALRQTHRVRPVLSARFLVASRSFSAPTTRNDRPTRFRSRGWGVGLAGALEADLGGRLTAEVTLGWSGYSFAPFPLLAAVWKLHGSRWSGTALQVGASWGLDPRSP